MQNAVDTGAKLRHKSKRTLAFSCCALLIAITIYTGSVYRSNHSRYLVVSKIDPSIGYHIEFTVSSVYEESPLPESSPSAWLESVVFNPKPESAFYKWVRKYVMRKPAVALNPRRKFEQSIVMVTTRYPTFWNRLTDPGGYIEMPLPPANSGWLVRLRAKSLVSGCSTTLQALDVPAAGTQPERHIDRLIVHPPGAPIAYEFVANSVGPNCTEQMLSELIAMRNSMRVIKSH